MKRKLLVNQNVRNYVEELDCKIYMGIYDILTYAADNYSKAEFIELLSHKRILDAGYKKITKSIFKTNTLKTKSHVDEVKKILDDIKSAQDALECVKRINRIYTADVDRIIELFMNNDRYSNLYTDLFNFNELKCIILSLLDAFPAKKYSLYVNNVKNEISRFNTQEELINKLYEIVNVISKDDDILPSLYAAQKNIKIEKGVFGFDQSLPDYKIRITDLYDPRVMYNLNKYIPDTVWRKMDSISKYYFYNGRNYDIFKVSNYSFNLKLLMGLLFDITGQYRLSFSYPEDISNSISNGEYTFKHILPLYHVNTKNESIRNILKSMNLELKPFDGKVYEDTNTNKQYVIAHLLMCKSNHFDEISNDLYIVLVENKPLEDNNEDNINEFKCVSAIQFKDNFKLIENDNITVLPEVKDYTIKYHDYLYGKLSK